MADLSTPRLNPGHPFQQCGVDYAGPFVLKAAAGQSKRMYKGNMALFIWFVTRDIHLELVTKASMKAFTAALQQFTATCVKPSDIYSNCDKFCWH
jgi:hypothetical protein